MGLYLFLKEGDMKIPKIVYLNGKYPDQRGTVEKGEITGYNGRGIPCRKYTWINPEFKELTGRTFEAFDDQIIYSMIGGTTDED